MKNKFEEFKINKDIIKALDDIGYREPTKVQNLIIPQLLNKSDIIVKSKTGSGKTASFSIPICENIDVEKNQIQALVIVPTRELAIQIKNEISSIGRYKKIRCEAIYGKQSIKEQVNTLKQRIHVVVSTPGRIIDLINRQKVDFKNINYLIIDEADKMFNKGFIEDMNYIISSTNPKKNIGLFSATIDDSIKSISSMYMINPIQTEIDNNELSTNNNINEMKMNCTDIQKYDVIKEIISKSMKKSIIIFLNTKENVVKLSNRLRKEGIKARDIHGDMSQEKRIHTIEDFKSNKFNILVSTDVASRGIHINNVSLVINYDVPKDVENYVHRIGRTGRKDSLGTSLTLVKESEEKYLKTIIEYINRDIKIGNIEDIISSINKNYSINKKQDKRLVKTNDISRIYLNAGKNKKIRVLDIVGALNNIKELNNDDIGVIKVEDICSYVDILNNKANILLKKNKTISIKNKLVTIKKDRNN